MKVWQVGISDCESCQTILLCLTKEIAIRELFKIRDSLIKEWQELDIISQKYIAEFCAKENKPIWVENMYKQMIKALSSDDYTQWDNYPHEKPWISEMEVIES